MSDATKKAAKAAYDRARRERLKEAIAAKKRAYYLANKEKENARVAAWCAENKTRSLEIKRGWKARNPDAEKTPEVRARRAEYMRGYRQTSPETHKRNGSLRRAKVSHATPPWADRAAIKKVYAKARQLGLHVDHEIPLNGKLVCGLHVENNLQLLPPEINLLKGNSYANQH